VEYTLTQSGTEIAKKVEALADWIELHLPEIIAAQIQKSEQ
jgi:DNA-binding HxlR family transcriptional regulator